MMAIMTRAVSDRGDRDVDGVSERNGGARLALPFSSIDRISTNGVSGKDKYGVKYVEYGFYPQSAVTRGLQQELERQFTSGRLTKTGNGYTTDSRKYDEDGEKFKAQRHEEYEYKGKRYSKCFIYKYYKK